MVRLAMLSGSGGHNGPLGDSTGTLYMGGPQYNGHGGDYYQPEQYYLPPEMCPAHHQLCIHGDYGPVTVPMVSTNSSPPIAMPVQVPPGHVVQQIVDENGTLRHVILSAQHPGHPGHMHHHMSHQHHGGPPHQHPGHFIPGNSSSQPFFPPGAISPHGYHPPHYHPSHIQPPGHMGGHVGPPPGNQTSHGQHSPHSTHSNHSNQSNHSNHSNHSPLGPHSPPPPNHSVPPAGALGGYQHKDERTQRQFVKLKRKLEQKQMRGDGIGINSGQSTPGLSPRKELVNGLRRGAARGMSSVGTSDDGEESSSVQDDDDDTQMIELLSSVQCPQVTEVTSRSALLLWKEPSSVGELYEKHLIYDVLLSDKGKEGKYKTIYSGAALSCRIQDLRPGQEYAVCLQVRLDDIQGSATDPMVITTPACEPDTPQPPKLIGRTRTSLQLRWNAAVDNGSHIQHYLLEYDEGKGGEFVELSKGKGKQNSLSKLQPSTCFKFRLAAVNECGKSAYSDIVAFSTSGSPPAQPTPPMLKAASVTSLQLSWNKRPNDEDFTLQMDDHYSKHGFLTVFTGAENEYVCHNLRRNSNFRFRLKAHNEEGPSRWSDEVNFTTLPDRPAPPSKPYVKGKIHAHSFKVKWDPPCDQGGAPISAYILEINTGSGFETIYSGHDTESVCDRLQPGTSYQLRVSCISAGGRSNNSEFGIITTEAVCPGPCAAPRPSGKPRATSAAITWTSPDYDGGAPVLEYEVELITDSDRRQAFKGKETECTIQELLPGLNYGFTVRAVNRIGAGAWSEELYLTSGAAPPDTPPAPEIVIKSATNVFVTWEEPNANGAPITEYRLETSSVDEEDRYNIIYQGSTNSYDFRNLIPFTTYYFRVAASNISGFSSLSPVSATVTPASTPAIMATPSYDVLPTQIELTWTEPCNHGAEIMFYNIEVVDKVYTTEGPVLEYVLDSLEPETVYRIKVQAVNSVGAGPFSPVLKVTTLPLPPAAPKLECIATGHNSLKLKWGDGKNSDFTQYCVEIYNQRAKEYQCVYQGTAFTCKVNKLQELSKYSFRICASNDIGGQGDFSDDVEFSTSTAPPSGLKAPKLIEVGLNSCLVEWTPCKATRDPISYTVQCCKARDQQYKEVYSGSDTKCTLEQLETGCEYHVRVLPVRLAPTGDLAGPPSPILSVSTLSLEPVVAPKTTTPNTPLKVRKHGSLSWFTPTLYADRKPLTDQQWAVVIIVGFIIIAVSAAVIAEQFIKSA